MSNVRPTGKQWNDFVRKFCQFDGESNVNADFATITKTAGVPYFEYLRSMWICTRESVSEEEFCRINGNIPIKFFEKNVRDHVITKEMEADLKIVLP
jgi:hypothetical protein